MKVIEPVGTMQLICRRVICESKIIRFVPTMGSLHAGHASLIKRAIEDKPEVGEWCEVAPPLKPVQLNGSTIVSHANSAHSSNNQAEQSKPQGLDVVVVVSIFVNPLQFNDRNDFVKYPISIESDLALCEQLKVDYVFIPKCRDIVRDFEADSRRKTSVTSVSSCSSGQLAGSRCVTLRPPEDEMSLDLEGKSRPNHFEGMLTIVCKLLNIVQPTRAYFGEKDYQQLVLVKRMVRELNMPVKICRVETVREVESNLPLSSRNGRLSEEQKQLAADLMYGALIDCKQCLELRCRRSIYDDINACEPPEFQFQTILLASLISAQCCSLVPAEEDLLEVDYFDIRCAKDLSVIEFDEALNLYDCRRGCVGERLLRQDPYAVNGSCQGDAKILEARLLISVSVARVRLLDNIEVQLNL